MRARASRAALRAPASRFQPLTPSPNPDTAHPCRFAAKTGQQSGCHFNFAPGGVILILRRQSAHDPATLSRINAEIEIALRSSGADWQKPGLPRSNTGTQTAAQQ